MAHRTIVFEDFFRPDQIHTYELLPFDLPAGTTRLEVQLRYSQRIGAEPEWTGGNTLDLGVFDARGAGFLGAGFRGWSGSERDSFVITETEATPGYLAGALIPGRWNVLLGLYKLGPQGCRVRAAVTLTSGPGGSPPAGLPEPIASLPSGSADPPDRLWLRGEMHSHTVHSDGDASPAELVWLARSRGLDFLAVTDHNTTSSQRELAGLADPGLLLIRGLEVTTFRGHFNAWGTGDWVDFRVQGPEDMRATLQYARAHGAVTACNHPKPDGPSWDFAGVTQYDCVEVWNGPWEEQNQASLDFWLGQLAQGRRVPAVGGSDYHNRRGLEQDPPRGLGTPTLWVRGAAGLTEAAVLEAIRAGHVSLSDAPDGPLLDLRAETDLAAVGGDRLARPAGPVAVEVRCLRGAGNRLRLWDQREVLVERRIGEAEETVRVSVPAGSSLYVRAELRDEAGRMKALTNPIYFDGFSKEPVRKGPPSLF